MIPYKNLSRESGVQAFESGPDFIIIQFKTHGTYLYDHERPGLRHVTRMIELALRGEGLATYINKHVRNNFAAKLV